MPTCPLCGAPLDADARYCPQCGAAVGPASGETPADPEPSPGSGVEPGAGAGAAPSDRQPVMSGISDENWAVFAHLSALAPLVVGVPLPFIGPLVLWLLARSRGPYAVSQSVEALNFNLSWLLWGIVLVIGGLAASVPTIGIALIPMGLLLAALVIAWLVLVVVAAVRASRGEDHRYPLTIRFVSEA